MTDKLTSSQKLVEFLYSVGLPPMRILSGLIFLLVIGTIAGSLYFLNFDSFRSAKGSDDGTNSEFVEDDRATYEFELTLDQQIDELTFFDTRNRNYVVVYGELQNQNEAIEKLRQRSDVTPEQTAKLDTIQLRNLQTLLLETLNKGVSAETERKAFDDFANKMANSSNEKSKNFAAFALARIAVNEFVPKPTEAKGQAVLDALNQHQASFVNTTSRAELLLTGLLQCRQQNPDNEIVGKCVATFGKLLEASNDAKIKNLAKQIGEFSLFAKINIGTLENRIRYRGRNALMDLDNALRVLEAHPEVQTSNWKELMRCYEASLSIGRIADFKTGRNITGELAARLPDSDERKAELLDLLTRQQKRAQQLGSQIDIAGDTLTGEQILPSEDEYTVLCLLDRSPNSARIMQELSNSQQERGKTFRPIIAFKDPFSKSDTKKIKLVPRWILVANEDTAKKYFEAVPVDFYPYLLLIDKNGVVVSQNLSLVQVANRIATLDKEQESGFDATLGQ